MSAPPTKFAVLLFPGFQALDVFGPLDVLNMLSRGRPFEFSVIAASRGPVPTRGLGSKQSIGQQIVATHTLQDAPEDIQVLLVPGGMGTRDTEARQPEIDFIRDRFPRLRFLLTVCTGAALAARAGVLDGRRATTNKASFDWVSRPRASVRLFGAGDDERHGLTWATNRSRQMAAKSSGCDRRGGSRTATCGRRRACRRVST
ncbi:hypothetical protein JDV02_002084 [Purpureocillium takamizusanense]|uniref:DJ-1/PfpI domain-containing protein n=1 Tax=Purpureocillium takamizusanense TaxID=2060973 RepID=A0A9Q8V864_9HYPO|nr:uncharacterized protein JDV02_002084 [Purpureocillium takamizusanense]UNI15559.1 hypothetical protein JDV02_002084 [Purpureocillium takamizusanense]